MANPGAFDTQRAADVAGVIKLHPAPSLRSFKTASRGGECRPFHREKALVRVREYPIGLDRRRQLNCNLVSPQLRRTYAHRPVGANSFARDAKVSIPCLNKFGPTHNQSCRCEFIRSRRRLVQAALGRQTAGSRKRRQPDQLQRPGQGSSTRGHIQRTKAFGCLRRAIQDKTTNSYLIEIEI